MEKATVSAGEIRQVTAKALQRHGALEWVAESVADAVMEAEQTGNLVCGLYYLESYCQQLETGRVSGKADPKAMRPKPGAVTVDAGFGFAQPAFQKGLPVALEAAIECGIASLAVAHAHTCTSLGFFTRQVASHGMIGIGFTNAAAVISPPGGSKPLLGTNPMAFSVPGRDGKVALQFDFSTSAVAIGKIRMAAAAGEEIPLGWAVDESGNPTTDPNEALRGSLLSAGGYKGYGLGLMVEIMASALTDSASSLEVEPLKAPEGSPHNLGQHYILIDPQARSGERFFQRLEALRTAVDEQPSARLPGSSRDFRQVVEVDGALWKRTRELAGAIS